MGKLGVYWGAQATPSNTAHVLSRLKAVYPEPEPLNRPGLLNKQEAVELAYWLISGLNAESWLDTDKYHVLSAVFYLVRGIQPPASINAQMQNWTRQTLSRVALQSPPRGMEKLQTWREVLREASLAAGALRLDLRIPVLDIASAGQAPRLARFEIHNPNACAGRILMNEQLLEDRYRHLTETASFALGVACLVHEMTHALQHAQLLAAPADEPFVRALRLACALDNELPSVHWLETMAALPEQLPPSCLLPHELQAWAVTKEALQALGRNNPASIKHIEQALLYISPTLKKMGLSNG